MLNTFKSGTGVKVAVDGKKINSCKDQGLERLTSGGMKRNQLLQSGTTSMTKMISCWIR